MTTGLIAFLAANKTALASIGLFVISEYLGNTKTIPENSVYSLVIRVVKNSLESLKKS